MENVKEKKIEEFEGLRKYEKDDVVKKRIVDWKQVFQQFNKKLFTYAEVRKYVTENFPKEKLYYSEIYRWIDTIAKNNKVEFYIDKNDVIHIALNKKP